MVFNKILLYKGGRKMKTAKKVWIIVAICLVVTGAIISVLSLMTLNFDFSNLSSERLVSNEYNITDNFSNIKIDVDTSDVELVRSQAQECMVVAIDTEKVKHNVSVENGTLYISVEDNRKWYDHIGIFWGKKSLTIHLPKEYYDSLDIEADTSDITVPKDFTFNTASVETDTGDIGFSANMSGLLDISTDTGDIGFGAIKAQDITLESDTGDVTFNSVECENVIIENNTGDVRFNSTIATGKISVTTSTGDVIFDYSDADEIFINTSTGDVSGRLLSEKVFICDSNTGKTDVPDSETGGRCEITTNTGDIEIYTNKNK